MKNRFTLILVILCIFSNCIAQSLSFTRVGSIGRFSDRGYVASLAICFNKASECVKLNTGVFLFGSTLGQRDFVILCKTNSTDENLEFNLFPNPVVTYARLVATGISLSLHQVNLSLVDASGRVLWREKVDANSLRTGYVLKLGHFLAGNYFLRVDVSGISKVIPFVKIH